jgi:dihydrofolate reductase
MSARISLIAGMARNRVIGAANRLPWHLPEDLKYFKRVTHGHPIVMGRKTYESIGRLLPGRENRIVTRKPDFHVEGARVFGSIEEACRGEGEIFVIGGAEIYSHALPFADRLYVTLIDRDFEGDAFFPEWDSARFVESSREDHPATAERGFGFSFVVFDKRP